MRLSTTLVISGAILLVWDVRLDAYLDPGSGSMLIQLLLGGVAGLAVILKLFWRRILDIFGLGGDDRRPSNDA
jgi:hypothetical protein